MKRIYFRPWTDWTRREFLLKLALLICTWISSPLSGATEFNIPEFGRLPIVFNGRHQPFDSLARNSLLQIREKQTANIEPWKSFLEKPKVLSATEWILGVMFRPEESDLWPVFRIDHPDLISLLNLPRKDLEKQADGKHFAWNRIEPGFKELHDQRSRILDTKKDASQRDSFDQAVLRLYECIVVYLRIKNTVHPQDSAGFAKELVEYQKLLQPGKTGAEVLRAKYSAGNMDAARNDPLVVDLGRYYTASKMEGPLILPPAEKSSTEWQRMGDSLMELRGGESLPLTIANYAKIADAYRQKDADAFNSGVVLQLREIETLVPRDIGKARQEVRFGPNSIKNSLMSRTLAANLAPAEALAVWRRR